MQTHLEIVTPEGRTFSDTVDLVVLPGAEGELGVLRAHAPLVTTLKPGELRYEKFGKEYSLAVGTGLLEVTPTAVSVLSDLAIREDDINEDAVQQALEKAQLALDRQEHDAEQTVELQMAIQKNMAMLQLKRRRREMRMH